MSWNKIEEHLFEKYCVEGEDKELCKLMKEHDKEIRNKAIEECVRVLQNTEAPYSDILNDRYDMIKRLRNLKSQSR